MGSKKRKAYKKKTKMGDGEDSNAHHSNSSTTHSHANEEPRSFDERESDGGEEEEEKVEEEAVDQLDGGAVEEKGLKEEVVRVEMEAKSDENGSGSPDHSSVSAEKEIHSLPGSEDVEEEKEVTVVEEEQSIVPEFGDEIPEAVDHVFEAAAGVEGGLVEEFNKSVEEQILGVESPKEVVAPPQEVSEGVSDVADLGFVKNAESVSYIPDDKENFSLDAAVDQQPEKIETEVASLDEGGSLNTPDVGIVSKENAVETSESGKQLEEKVISLDTATIDEKDNVKDGEVQMQSHDNGAANTSREADNGEELEGEKQSEEKALINPNPLPVRRTSWAGCCGLFEVFSASSR